MTKSVQSQGRGLWFLCRMVDSNDEAHLNEVLEMITQESFDDQIKELKLALPNNWNRISAIKFSELHEDSLPRRAMAVLIGLDEMSRDTVQVVSDVEETVTQ